MTDISESGIEAARKAVLPLLWERNAQKVAEAAIQAYLPFHPPAETHEEYVKRVVTGHPPASREEGLREAALEEAAQVAETNAFGGDRSRSARETGNEIAKLIRALIPTKPEAKEPTIDLALIEATARKINPGRSEDHIKSVALDALTIFRALQSKKPE